MMELSKVQTLNTDIEFGSIANNLFESYLSTLNASSFAILCDENTSEAGLEFLITSFSILSSAEIIEIPAGEESKCIEIYCQILETLSEAGCDRKAVLINLGGGVVTDLGGFVASTYKRGIRFINLPMSLLGMVDASIGGKNGIDFGIFKNMVGTFAFPEKTFIDGSFLASLSEYEVQNGFAEMLKHGLIADRKHAQRLIDLNPKIAEGLKQEIEISAKIKIDVVQKDPFEKGNRAILNFGHTIGHCIEGVALMHQFRFSHGHGVALGMFFALQLSIQKLGLNILSTQPYLNFIKLNYPIPEWVFTKKLEIFDLLKHDKKNENGLVKFVLLEEIGQAVFGVHVGNEEVENCFDFCFESGT